MVGRGQTGPEVGGCTRGGSKWKASVFSVRPEAEEEEEEEVLEVWEERRNEI